MPTEHEYKYVISNDMLRDYSEQDLRALSDNHIAIQQGYLAFSKGMSCRIRSATEDSKVKWFLTFKQKVTNRVVEVEKKLDERDGMDLWSVAVGKLKKDRYILNYNQAKWEVDLFKTDGQVYFLLAEVELEEGMPRPKKSPPLLRTYIIKQVELTDDRFSNKRLGDVNYARQLYEDVIAEGITTVG